MGGRGGRRRPFLGLERVEVASHEELLASRPRWSATSMPGITELKSSIGAHPRGLLACWPTEELLLRRR